MDFKKIRHFLFGLLFGAGTVYGYTFHFDSTVQLGLDWLQREADAYRAEHPETKVDSGWGNPAHRKK